MLEKPGLKGGTGPQEMLTMFNVCVPIGHASLPTPRHKTKKDDNDNKTK